LKTLNSWLKKCSWFWFFIAILEAIYIFVVLSDNVKSLFNNLLMDSEGNTDWNFLIALAAIITIVSSWLINNKNIKANIVSKSIITWLENARNTTSQLLSSANNCLKNYNMFSDRYFQGWELNENGERGRANLLAEEANKYKDEANLQRADVIKNLMQFKLLFGNNAENNYLTESAHNILDIINEIIDETVPITSGEIDTLQKANKVKENIEVKSKYGDLLIEIFVENCRLYFKREWDKAKFGSDTTPKIKYVKLNEKYSEEDRKIIANYQSLK